MSFRFTLLSPLLLLPAWLWAGRSSGAKRAAGTRWTLQLHIDLALVAEEE